MERNAFGYYPLQLGDEHFLLDIERREQIVCAWLYPVEEGVERREPVSLRDPYALDLTELGIAEALDLTEAGRSDDDAYDLTDDEIADTIAEALDMTEIEAGLEADRSALMEGVSVDAADGMHEWALAGYRMAVFMQRTKDVFSGSREHLIGRLDEALAEYRKATGADLTRSRRPIPWAFDGPGEKEAA